MAVADKPAQNKVEIGLEAPDFTLPDQTGNRVSLKDFRGQKAVVLYFYPKDNTTGCTAEACAFRDSYEVFKDTGAEVIGVSSDNADTHQGFASRYQLPFVLLSDAGGKVRKQYGVPTTFGLIPGRVTYVIDKEGVVRHIFNSQFMAAKHVEEALKVLKALIPDTYQNKQFEKEIILMANANISDITVKTSDGKEKTLGEYQGKVLLIVNVASKCGYTPQYAGLEKLYETYKGQGLEILGFPSNDYGGQEPGSNEEIASFCQLNYGVTFDIFDKLHAKGPEQHPLYTRLTKESLPAGEVKWNFEKFLVDKQGNIVARYPSAVTPEAPELVGQIKQQLAS
jgi:glutathione peroxidase